MKEDLVKTKSYSWFTAGTRIILTVYSKSKSLREPKYWQAQSPSPPVPIPSHALNP